MSLDTDNRPRLSGRLTPFSPSSTEKTSHGSGDTVAVVWRKGRRNPENPPATDITITRPSPKIIVDEIQKPNPEAKPPPGYYSQIGSLDQRAIEIALMGGIDNLDQMIHSNEPLTNLKYDLIKLNSFLPGIHPFMSDVADGCRTISHDVVEMFAKRDHGRQVEYIAEPSITPPHRKFREAAESLREQTYTGKLSPKVIFNSARPYSDHDRVRHRKRMDNETRKNLDLVTASSVALVNNEAVAITNDSIRPDLLRVAYTVSENNKDMPDLMAALNKIKRGPGTRRHLNDYAAWVNEEIDYLKGKISAKEAVEKFLTKILNGDITVSVIEIKTHLNGISRIKVPVDNTDGRSPVVDIADVDSTLVRDVGATTSALFNFALNFLPKLRFKKNAKKFMQNVRAEILEANLNMIFEGADKAHAQPKDMKYPQPQIRMCQLRGTQLINVWQRRDEDKMRNAKKNKT